MDLSIVAEWLAGLVLSLFIYQDATAHKIGRVKQERSLVNFPAGAWALSTLLIWPVIFYLIFRTRLIARAEKNPVMPSAKQKKKTFIILTVLGLIAAFTLCWPDQKTTSWKF